jgi:hypothetical protein
MKTLIHVGLGKCLSTSLQHCWKVSTNYNCFHIEKYSKKINKAFEKKNWNTQDILNQSKEYLRSENIQYSQEKINIITCEGLTFSFLNKPHLSELIPKKWEIAAKTLQGTAEDALLVVRDPIDWIKSAYAQYIKQGGVLLFPDFIKHYERIIYFNLHIKRIAEAFNRNGFKLKILPMEAYKEDPDEFWNFYEEILNLDRPNQWHLPTGSTHGNFSLYDTLEIHRVINLTLRYLENIHASNSLPNTGLSSTMTDTIAYVRKWGSRRALESATEQQLRNLAKILNCETRTNFRATKIPTGLLESINKNFLNSIQNYSFPFSEILASYTKSVADEVSRT